MMFRVIKYLSFACILPVPVLPVRVSYLRSYFSCACILGRDGIAYSILIFFVFRRLRRATEAAHNGAC